MANKKVKHVTAKTVGTPGTYETLDFYDIDALHNDKLYNGLDGTSDGFALDAKQGPAISTLINDLNNSLDSGISELNSSISELNSTMSNKVASLQNSMNKRALKRRFILIGDSYGVGVVGAGTSNVNGWPVYFKAAGKLSNDDCYVSVNNGSGFLGLVSKTFLNCLQEVNASDPSTITDIVVVGGANDGDENTSGNLVTAMDSFYTYAKSKYPNAVVWQCFAGCSRSTSTNKRAYLKNAKATYLSNTSYASITPADYFLNVTENFYGTDSVHFNQNGYKALGEWVYGGVMGASRPKVSTVFVQKDFGQALNGCTLKGKINYRIYDNYLLWLVQDNFSVIFGSTKPTAGTPFSICKLPAPFFGDIGNYLVQCSTYGNAKFSGGYETIPLTINIKNGEMQIDIWNATGSGFRSLSTLEHIAFAPDIYKFPLEFLV